MLRPIVERRSVRCPQTLDMTRISRIGDAIKTALSQEFEGASSSNPASNSARRDHSPTCLPGALQKTFEAIGEHVQSKIDKIETMVWEAKRHAGRVLDKHATLAVQHQALLERAQKLEDRGSDKDHQTVDKF